MSITQLVDSLGGVLPFDNTVMNHLHYAVPLPQLPEGLHYCALPTHLHYAVPPPHPSIYLKDYAALYQLIALCSAPPCSPIIAPAYQRIALCGNPRRLATHALHLILVRSACAHHLAYSLGMQMPISRPKCKRLCLRKENK